MHPLCHSIRNLSHNEYHAMTHEQSRVVPLHSEQWATQDSAVNTGTG